jgi:3-deoxy-manno-octulosonate cytidylyltransferase (CMP-KDO synthetase)
MRAAVIIPARFGSTRFEGKPLALICGKPMIEWVLRGANGSKLASYKLVATDDERILNFVKSIGFDAVMTSSEHRSGSDRVAEAARDLDVDIVVNLQGDEPLIEPELIDRLIEELNFSEADIATPVTRFLSIEELNSLNTAKVVTTRDGYALYFSRAVIPMPRNGQIELSRYLKHIGIYAYRKESLMRFVSLPPSELEVIEKLEQLRALENGMRIKVFKTEYRSISVDVREDIERVESEMKARGICES